MEEKIWTRDFILIFIANFLSFLGFQMLSPTLPLYVRELGGNDIIVGWVVGSFTFSALLIRPYAGHAVDMRGRKPILLAGTALLAISAAAFAWVGQLLLLLLLRVIQGVSWGLATTASGTVATDLIPPRRRGEGMGYFSLSSNLAMTFGPALGLTIVGLHHFDSLFACSAALCLTSLLLAGCIKMNPVPGLGQRHAATAAEEHKKTPRWDLFEKAALLPTGLTLLIAVTFGSISSFLPLYATQKGVDGIQWYFVVFAVIMMLTRPLTGKLYDRKGHRAIFVPGAVLVIAAMTLLSGMHSTMTLLLAAVLYGAGFGAIQSAMQAWAVENVPPTRRGMANATFFSGFDLGIGFGAILFGFIAQTIGYGNLYLVAIIPVVLSIAGYLFYTVLHKKEKQPSNASF